MRSLFVTTAPGRNVFFALTLVFFGSLGLDQVTKQHAEQTMINWQDPTDTDRYYGKQIPFLRFGAEAFEVTGNYIAFGLQYSRNKGAAFSMFSTLDDSIRIPLFNGINILATILIIFYLRATPLSHTFTRYGLVSVFSGATGNFVDRLHRGYVVDFCDVEWRIFGWQHNFAIFNVADIAINIGVVCLLLDMFLHRHDPQPAKNMST